MKLKLVRKTKENKYVKSFFWQPQEEVDWEPGQYFYYTLPEKKLRNDSRGPNRMFTIASSPTEGKLLQLTTKFDDKKSIYKEVLDQVKIGEEIEGSGPSGVFTLDNESQDKTLILLAGGIGITPFRSFIKFNIDKNLKIPMHLIYSNSSQDEVTFQNELENWSKNSSFFTLYTTITKPGSIKCKWNGLKGRIDEDMIKKVIAKSKLNLKNTAFWVVGPPQFVYAMQEIAGKFKALPQNFHTEIFTGY